MQNYLNLQLLGNLTSKPQLKTVTLKKDGKEESVSVANGTIAINLTKEKTMFLSYEIWGKRAENAEKFLEKGSKVFVQDAELCEPNKWTASDGTLKAENHIKIKKWIWLDKKEQPEETEEEEFKHSY